MDFLRKAVLKVADEIGIPANPLQNDVVLMEVASIDEVYMDVTTMANHLVDRINADESCWQSILENASFCTTIGGIEVLSEAAQATNSLGKDELRRGSHVQVLDSNLKIDAGSLGWWNRDLSSFSNAELRLACGAYLAARARSFVQSTFDGGVFTLSAGVSSNKTLAKLASGLKKPNRQTLVYRDPRVLQKLFHPLPLGRIRGLGGKFGTLISDLLSVETVGQLAEIPLSRIQYLLSQSGNSKSAKFLYDISRGLCMEPVTPRSKPKSIECSKTFRGPLAISVRESAKLEKWIGELCSEVQTRLQQDKDEYSRYASTMKVSVQFNTQKSFLSKQTRSPRLDQYPKVAMDLVQSLINGEKQKLSGQRINLKDLKITGIGVGGSQFVDVAAGSASILSALQNVSQDGSPTKGKFSGTNSQTRFLARPEKRRKLSNLEVWLQGSSNGSSSNKKGKTITTDVKAPDTKPPPATKDTFQQYTESSGSTTQMSTKAVVQPSTMSLKLSAMPGSMDEIDPEVLRALPKDLQLAVLGDLRQQKKQKREREKLRQMNFFERSK
jgi:DNA polymerase eta